MLITCWIQNKNTKKIKIFSYVYIKNSYVLSQILSSSDRDTVVKNVHQFLTQLGENTRQGKVSLDKYIIKKVKLFTYLNGETNIWI